MRHLLLFVFLISFVSSYKFLSYSPQFASSHANFMGKISDALVDAGHEVVMLSPILDTTVKFAGAKKARVISLPQSEKGDFHEYFMNEKLVKQAWTYQSSMELMTGWNEIMEAWTLRCNETIHYPGLIEELKREKFDVAFGESLDFCIGGLFHIIGIEKYAITDSLAVNDGSHLYTHIPTNPSYVPGLMSAEGGEKMNFIQRLTNLVVTQIATLGYSYAHQFHDLFLAVDPNIPDLMEILANNSLVFVNSEPLVDFPRPTAARIIDIGGISVSSKHNKLNETWSNILDLRPRTVIISFGSFAKAHLMPSQYKENIRETIRRFPDVTFIWKYEKPEDHISEGVDNLIETTWMPQNDLLHDPRLSAFVTHCGQGSTTEANYAGVPLVVIPVAFDQLRNALQVERNGLGIILERNDLSSVEPLENALREVLDNPKYREKAKKVQLMLQERPFTMNEIFVKNMEFLAKHGPLRQLDHYGRHLNFFQYYLIDVISFMGAIVLLVVIIVVLVLKKILTCLINSISAKKVKTL